MKIFSEMLVSALFLGNVFEYTLPHSNIYYSIPILATDTAEMDYVVP